MVCPFITKRRHTPLFFAYLQGVFNLRSIMSQIIIDVSSVMNALLDRCEAAVLIFRKPSDGISTADQALLNSIVTRQTALTVSLEQIALTDGSGLSNGSGISDGSSISNGSGVSDGSGVPVISSPADVSATLGVPFSFSLKASNNPTSYTASGLPAWAMLNTSTGAITGTPNVTGRSAVKVNALNNHATGQSVDSTLTITVS